MTHKVLNQETIRKLLKKADETLPRLQPLFSDDDMALIRKGVKDRKPSLELKAGKFRLSYNRFRNEDWVRMNPIEGYTPMFHAEVRWVLDPEKAI